MKYTTNSQNETPNEVLQKNIPLENPGEDELPEEKWWDSLCYPDSHVSER